MKSLIEPKGGILTIGYHPNGEIISENPPRFTWMPETREDETYQLQISKDVLFANENTRTYENISHNFFTLDESLEPGVYYWRYTIQNGEYGFSKVRELIVPDGIPITPIPLRDNRYHNLDMNHPRIWMNQEEIKEFKKQLRNNEDYCNFKKFYENSVLTYASSEFIKEPLPYPNDQRVVSLWRRNYQDCQLALEYIRSLSVAGVLLENNEYISLAKEALINLTKWDINGSTSRNYNDECSFRVVYALAFGYDWLYNYLNLDEKNKVLECLYTRTKQVANHIIKESKIHISLYDSHAVRSLSSVITPCCIAMLGEKEEAKNWLDYALDYFSVIYTPWGGSEGGWAEGGLYWTSGMAFLTEALNIIKSYLHIDLYKRPFFQKTGDFPLYCMPVDTYRASFCDQSNLGKYPGHKTAYNMRQFAGITGKEQYQWYYEQVMKREPVIDQDFFNKGWWDFYYDDMVYQHSYGEIALKEEGIEQVKWFKDIGWVAINKDLKNPKNHIFFLTKSSPYGSVSHSHGDQNSFVLFAFGEPLIIKSGYYIGFNTSMHREWRRQTRSHNTLLIDGHGQYAGMDKPMQLSAKGKIEEVTKRDNLVYIKEDATESYRINVPNIKEYTREIYFVDEMYFVIVDTVKTIEESEIDFLLHSLTEFEITGQKFRMQREKAGLTGEFVYCSSNIEKITQHNEFEGVNEDEVRGLDKQWHLKAKTNKAKNHILITLLVPYSKKKEEVVTCIKDDQGMDIYLYFCHEDKTFSLKIDGSKRYN